MVQANDIFGWLTVVERLADGSGYWRCLCKCGKKITVVESGLKSRRSCGCGTLNTTHGLTLSPEYHAWQNMKRRCYKPTFRNYENYGGRGITVCDEWRASFEAFIRDVGKRPSPNHGLDRIDNEGDYEPANVEWVLQTINDGKRRNRRMIKHNGKTQSLADWARELGVRRQTLARRIEMGKGL